MLKLKDPQKSVTVDNAATLDSIPASGLSARRIFRRIQVTAGLAFVGGASGAIAGGVTAALVLLFQHNRADTFKFFEISMGCWIGLWLGAPSLPLVAWLLMRHVPIGRAISGSVAGTVLGGTIGWFSAALWSGNNLVSSLIGGFIGFACAAVALRFDARRQ